jgi:hypothetical protein
MSSRNIREKDREIAGTVLAFCLMVSTTVLAQPLFPFIPSAHFWASQVGLNSGAQVGDALNAIWFSKVATC